MKPLSNHRITKFVAAAALAGLSIVGAYAAPNYLTPVNSPIDTTSLVSVSAPLNNFNGYLQAIDAQLAGVATLRTPDLGGGTTPSDKDFVAAVAAAVAADTAHAAEIVSAGVQYKPAKAKDILVAVATGSPAFAPAAVGAAAIVAPTKAADIALGAIKGLIVNGANNAVMDDAAAAALNSSTRALIEKVSESAVSATKTSSTQNASATEVASKLLEALLADSLSSNSELYIDDVARGALAGAKGFASTTMSDVATAMAAKFAGAGLANTANNRILFAMGALQSSIINDAGASGFAAVRTALTTALPASSADITAGAKVNQFLRQQALLGQTTSAQLVANYQSQLTATEYDSAYAYIVGALQFKNGEAANFVTASFTDPQAGAGFAVDGTVKKQAFVAGATTANAGAVAKIVTNAIAAGGGLTPALAVSAAIPAATDQQGGLAVTAAIKNGGGLALLTPDAQGVLSAAISAAVGAGYQRALPDIALAAAKARKDIDDDLVATAIADVPAGWEEAAAAFIVANNSKEVSVKAAAIDAANTKNPAITASVTLALNIAIAGKASSKTLYDDAIASLNGGGSALPRAVIFGAGAVSSKITVPLLAAAMRLKTGGDSDATLLNYSISLSKKTESLIRLGYETAQDVIANPDNLFDVVDHKILTDPKAGVEITSAAVAARPEYAHYAARAAAFRAPASVGKIATAAIEFAHMRTNVSDDPAAVAAISAATVLGVKDAKLTSAKTTSLMSAAVTGLVKGCLLFTNTYAAGGKDDKLGLQGNLANFLEATGSGSTLADVTMKRSRGTAGVLTGAIIQLQAVGATTLDALSITAITAAAKAAKTHGLAFAQAAGAAAQAAARALSPMTDFIDFGAIASALTAAGIADTGFANAAQVGAAQFNAGIYGAGAAGVLNYAHNSSSNTPVTSISNF